MTTGARGEHADHGQVAAGPGIGQERVGRQVEHGQPAHRDRQGRVVDAEAAPARGAWGAGQGGGQGAQLDPEGDPEDAAPGGHAAPVDADEEQPEQHGHEQGEQDHGLEGLAVEDQQHRRATRLARKSLTP